MVKSPLRGFKWAFGPKWPCGRFKWLSRRCAALNGPSALSGPAGLSSELRSEATLNHLKGEARFKGGEAADLKAEGRFNNLKGEARFKGGEAADLKAEGRLNPLEGVARNPWGFTLWIPGDLTSKPLGG